MRIFVFSTVLTLLGSYCFAAGPDFIRVRTFKNLNEFPVVANAKIDSLSPVAWRLSGTKLIFAGKKLPEKNVILKKSSRYEIVSVLKFNDYLAGVIASEMPVSWPLEALKAQAVVARSFTLARLREKRPGYFDMESDESDQMFAVTSSVKAYQAVLETEDLVLQDDRDRTLKAYYHSDCGGQTVNAGDVWGGGGFQPGTAQDSWCLLRASNRWVFQIDRQAFLRKLGLRELPEEPFQLVWKDRSQTVNLFGAVFTVQKLRQIFGFSNIKSTPSKLVVGEKTVTISGQGFGHGAGLCQWGTRAQAQNGAGFREVLSHYYPRAHLSTEKVKLAALDRASRELFAVSN
jgi:stage II sporulation protein D